MDKKELLLGIDIGTTTSKGVLTDAEGNIVSAFETEHNVSRPFINYAEHDPEDIWWADMKKICRQLVFSADIRPEVIRGISISAIYPAIVPLNEDGRPLRPAILYGIDQRATKEIAFLKENIGSLYSVKTSNNDFSSQSIGPKILWIKNHENEIFKATKHFLYPTGYINYRMTGRYVCDHASASLGGLPYNIHDNSWDESFCQYIGVTPEMMGELMWSGEKIAQLLPEAAKELGLSPDTMVICGSSDHAAETVSNGGCKIGQGLISYGTTFGFDVCTDRLAYIPGITTCSTGFPRQYLIGGGMATGAALTTWFRDELGKKELEEEASGGINAYQQLSMLAKNVPAGSEGLIVLPYFSGERCPFFDPNAVGAFWGLTMRHTKAHMYRAILEGVAFGIRQIKEILDENGISCTDVNSIGGGTKSSLWTQILSDVTGFSQNVQGKSGGSALGDAMIAGLGLGCYPDISCCSDWIGSSVRIEPDKGLNHFYDKQYKVFLELYKLTEPLEEKRNSLLNLTEYK